MRIEVDRGKCEGLGMCEAMARDFFELDDDDQMHVLNDSPDDADRGQVNAAVQSCPVLALTLVG
ncbi:MAG: ferredoxin [Actinomycetota bacterium]|nr:ferredoxin [Actinomycetota bacterium]